ncbi:major capsid protein [Moraxella bovis]|uniref:major capsid protein n=1 Tax=Moraxella bovis TaxID=476 RepID=UPI002225FE3B|nr:major capsid protein [Moraxella bovis]UYZ91020.1 major capsid protein [Moraxella bovis]UYZ91033.1 major capsid protein [Moraxella bovis]
MSKYDAQLAVYQPKPTLWQKTKKHATNASLALAVGVSSVPAFAAVDVTELVTEIGGNKTGMNSVGMAILGLVVLVVGFGMIRRMMR